MSASLKRIVKNIFYRNEDQHPIPNMDGNLAPNNRLENAREIASFEEQPDHMAIDRGNTIFISTGHSILRAQMGESTDFRLYKTLPGKVGGLCNLPDGRLAACVAGHGVVVCAHESMEEDWLREVDGVALNCATCVSVTTDGTIFITEGSSEHLPQDWAVDLIKGCRAGRLIRCDLDLKNAVAIRGNLAFPHGCIVEEEKGQLLYTESWTHTLSGCDFGGGSAQKIIHNLPGYPARISGVDDGTYWLSIFAVRTHLVELVLDDESFRNQMTEEIEPRHWIAPALLTTNSYMEPLQGGGVKKLGIIKPWAPPRSYGLAIHVDQEGDILESLHSRVGGNCHGIMAVCQWKNQILVLSKGHQRLVSVKMEDGE